MNGGEAYWFTIPETPRADGRPQRGRQLSAVANEVERGALAAAATGAARGTSELRDRQVHGLGALAWAKHGSRPTRPVALTRSNSGG